MYCNVQNKRREENEKSVMKKENEKNVIKKEKKLNTNGEVPTRLLL